MAAAAAAAAPAGSGRPRGPPKGPVKALPQLPASAKVSEVLSLRKALPNRQEVRLQNTRKACVLALAS